MLAYKPTFKFVSTNISAVFVWRLGTTKNYNKSAEMKTFSKSRLKCVSILAWAVVFVYANSYEMFELFKIDELVVIGRKLTVISNFFI